MLIPIGCFGIGADLTKLKTDLCDLPADKETAVYIGSADKELRRELEARGFWLSRLDSSAFEMHRIASDGWLRA